MTYKELIQQLAKIPTSRLDDEVIVWDYWNDEFMPACAVKENKEGSKILDTNVLDYGHFVLELKN